jgi:amino acid adenylation domain-containing protein/non-ribosomal peptide synthase protein (TIGR01720 family)
MKNDISKKLAKLTPEQRALLEKKLREKSAEKKNNNSIPIREDISEYPLSFAQRSLWFLSQLNKDSAFYNMPALIEIVGKLNFEALEKSINEVIKRHEVLRSNYIFDSEPKQRVKDNLELKTLIYNIDELNGKNEEEKIEIFANEEGAKPFDLTNDSMIRASLIKVNDEKNILIVTFHHIVADGWSLAVFVNEIIQLYTAFSKNETPTLPELKIQYADFAKWQKDKLDNNVFNSQIDYWKKQLANLSGNLNLPLDKPRPKTQTFNGLHKSFEIEKELYEKVKEFSKQNQTTMFVVMLSVYQALLYRYTSQEDIAVGSPIAYRDKPELQNLIGFFINTLVFRSDFSDTPTFSQLIKQVHKNTMDAFENKDIPFEKVVDALKIKRTQEKSPLFQTLFVMQNTPSNEIKIPGLTFRLKEVETGNVKFDLTLSIEEKENHLEGLIGYNTDLFNKSTIDEFINRFKIFLNNVLENPDLQLAKVALVSSEEKEEILEHWSKVEAPKNLLPNLHSLFESQVTSNPNAVAIEFPTIEDNGEIKTKSFTYDEVNRKANILAHHLLSKNVKPDSIVALSLNRSPEMIIALLAILKSGAAYLPIDPKYPESRKNYMLKDSDVKILITESSLLASFEDYEGEKLNITDIFDNYSESDIQNPNVNVSHNNLAYIIYTSGSTGKPKGVAVTHKSIVNYIMATSDSYGFTSKDRVLQFSSISFDAAAEEIYHTLYKGGTLVLRPEAMISSPKIFLDYSEKLDISIWDMPTAYWHQLVQEIIDENRNLPKNLHSLLIGGERIEPAKAKLWINKFGDKVKFFNTYGPTETTVVSLFYQITEKDKTLVEYREVPIGKPVNGLSAFVLDENFNPVPKSFPGELCVGGIGLAKGYLNKPEITQKSFVINPFGKDKTERIYRTGDKVRMLDDENIEYLGRIDDQVKVRGFRIELKEINNLLQNHKDIKESVILTRKDKSGQNILLAFYVSVNNKELENRKIREFLKESLPDYMIPSSISRIDSIPLTTNGKINTKELLSLNINKIKNHKDYKPPTNELEMIIAKMWADVLNIEQIGIDENFFEIGGDSLKAAVFINNLQKKLGEVVWVVSLFDNQTVSLYSDYLTSNYYGSLEKLLEEDSAFLKTISKKNKVKSKTWINSEKLDRMKKSIEKKSYLNKYKNSIPKKENSRTTFILSAPRSGSTLLRVMLSGNPNLFVPPELALMLFEKLEDRRKAFEGREKGWSEGLTRAIMQIYKCDYIKANQIIEEYEKKDLTVQEFYYQLQELIGNKLLVDKTTTYASNPEVLLRAEEYFDNAKYIHITRHPSAMIQSYLNSKLNEVFGAGHEFSERENAELFWVLNNQNVTNFLEKIPGNRKYFVKYENLVSDPRKYMVEICNFLEIPFDEEMLFPYNDKYARMTDGIHPESHMVGDPRFHEHVEIDSKLANKWQELPENDYLSDITIHVSKKLNYKISDKDILNKESNDFPRNKFEEYLVKTWSNALNKKEIKSNDNFFKIGGNEKIADKIIETFSKEFGVKIPTKAFWFAPTITKFSVYAYEYYPDKIKTYFGNVDDTEKTLKRKYSFSQSKILADEIKEFKNLIVPAKRISVEKKNKKTIFILSPPRSGSTLLRIMLAGNEKLFSPPELELLSFSTLKQRREELSENYGLWLESTIKVIMELKNCSVEEAESIMAEMEEKDISISDFYNYLQGFLGDRILVDKTPTYSLDINILKRAEETFDKPIYIHLARNPYASIYSFIDANLDKNFFRYKHSFDRRKLAELIWTVSNQNILNFLEKIPDERKFNLKFEDLLLNPEEQMQKICEFVNIEYDESMIKPYQGKRMTEPVRKGSQMVGDFKFYLHSNVDKRVIDKWKNYHKTDFLNDNGLRIANALGYKGNDLTSKNIISQIKRIDRNQELSLSFAQQRIWFLEQLEPGKPTYNIPGSVRIKGKVDVTKFHASINEIVKRHESLRTIFPSEEGKVKQIILNNLQLPIDFVDLTNIDRNLREQEANKILLNDAKKSFNLEKGPLIRWKLVKIYDEEYFLLTCMHHIISDGWSVEIFVKELATVYSNIIDNKKIKLPELQIEYVDYAFWQKEWMQSDLYKKQIEYWKENLKDAPPLLELPTDFPRNPIQTQDGNRISFEISDSIFHKLQILSISENTTMFTLLLTVFNTLLNKYSSNNDILIGTPAAGRIRKELEGIIGLFVNTLVIRTNILATDTFTSLLKQVRKKVVHAISNQEIPFEKLIDELNIERSLSHSPLFQVMFVYNQSPLKNIKTEGLIIEPLPLNLEASKFDITLSLTQNNNSIVGVFEYNTALFKRTTIERMIGHYKEIINEILKNKEAKINELRIITEAEHKQVINEFNNRNKKYKVEKTLQEIIEEKVKESPESIAVTFEGKSHTYFQLNNAANKIAQKLIAREKVSEEKLIGLYMERGVEMIVGILGILKAGYGYLPMDPVYPNERLSFMLEDAKVKMVITQERIKRNLPKEKIDLMIVDENILEEENKYENIDTAISPEDLAYCIYTSGSTGKPKGTLITHKNVIRLFKATEDKFHFNEKDVWSMFHSFAFDFSVWEIFGALLYGGKLVIVPYLVSRNPEEFYKLMIEEKVTVLNQTPSAFRQLIEVDKESEGKDNALRYIIFGGEALELSILQTWIEKHGDAKPELINMYGITETTVHVTYRRILKSDIEKNKGSIIGKPIEDLQVYILDENLNVLPIGIPGEIYVGGEGLAEGYLNRKDLTKEKFIENPFEDGERLYKSGDLAKFDENGELEYLGRIDNQVKIRGFRIELGEIEKVLDSHELISKSLVLTIDNELGSKKLVGYLVADKKKISIVEIKEYAAKFIPEYMIPSAFVFMDQFPLTPNGKINRKDLPKPEINREDVSTDFVLPSTEKEIALAEIVKELLKIDKVGVDDNFFELGGDSIIAIQVIAKANKVGIGLSPKDLFMYPNIRGLASISREAIKIHADQETLSGEVQLTPIQKWFFELNLQNQNQWNQSILLDVNEPLDEKLFKNTIAKLVEHHDALRMKYNINDEEISQAYLKELKEIPFEEIDLSTTEESDKSKIISDKSNEIQASLNLVEGKVFKCVYFYLGENKTGKLLIAAHHLVIDGVSWRILTEDLFTIYEQLKMNVDPVIPNKTTSFAYWAKNISELAESKFIDDQIDYWKKLKYLQNPTKSNGIELSKNIEKSIDKISVSLEEKLTESLLQEVPKIYNTEINEVLLTALVLANARWKGSRKMSVALEGHGREPLFDDIDTSRTIGWFTTLYPIVLDLQNSITPSDSLKTIKESMRKIPNNGIGYGIIKYFSKKVSKSDLPHLPEISFNYLGQFNQIIGKQGDFNVAKENKGRERAENNLRPFVIDIVGSIFDSKLQMSWIYSKNIHSKEDIISFSELYMDELIKIIETIKSDKGGYTPSDFQDVDLDEEELGSIFSELDEDFEDE